MLTRSVLLSLICSLALTFSAYAQSVSGTPWIDEIRAHIAMEGHARVLVRFQINGDRMLIGAVSGRRTNQRFRENASISEMRSAIRHRGEALKRDLALHRISIEHEYRNSPVMLATVDIPQFERLLENEEVISIQLDRPFDLEKSNDLGPVGKSASNRVRQARERPQIMDSIGEINAPAVWELGHTGEGQGVVILGNGFHDDHNFLSGKIVHQACFSREVDDGDESLCRDGTESQTRGRAASYCPSHIYEVCGRGTHAAGIAAGKDEIRRQNSLNGVAPDAGIIAIQVFTIARPRYCLDGCLRVYPSSLVDALEYVIDIANEYNIGAVNMSGITHYLSNSRGLLFSACDNHFLKPAIDTLRALGIATVISAGNGWYGFVSDPACISSAITVSSSLRGSYPLTTNQSPLVDLLAPGHAIDSAWTGNSFVQLNGPIAAAPHVTGAIALLKSAMPSATVDQVEYALKAGGPLNSGPAWSFATPRLDVLAALDLLGEDPPLEGLAVPGVLTSNSASARSYIRLHNTSGARGRADITLVDDDSGETVTTYARRLRGRSTLQIGISDIEAEAAIDLSEVGLTYTAYVESDFAGRLQHVLWNPGEGVLTNVSPCVDGFTDPGRFLAYVHTSLIQSYPSSFFVHNNRSIAARAEFTAYSNITGRELGRVETPEIAPYASIAFAASDAYDAISFQPRDSEFHVNFVLSEDFRGFAQHIVDNRDAGVVTNMTASCELPDNTVKILSQ